MKSSKPQFEINQVVTDDESEDGWLSFYANIVTLLLVVFVALFSMSTLDPLKVNALSNSIANYISFKETTSSAKRDVTASERQAEGLRVLSLMLGLGSADEAVERVLKIQNDEDEKRKLRVAAEKLGLLAKQGKETQAARFEFVLPSELLFKPDSSALIESAQQKLSQFAVKLRENLKKPSVTLEISAYAGSSIARDHRLQKSSATEISSEDALSVYRALLSAGVPEGKMRVVARGMQSETSEQSVRRVVLSLQQDR